MKRDRNMAQALSFPLKAMEQGARALQMENFGGKRTNPTMGGMVMPPVRTVEVQVGGGTILLTSTMLYLREVDRRSRRRSMIRRIGGPELRMPIPSQRKAP